MRWTLVFASFFGFTVGVITSRLSVGQPLILLGVVGIAMQTERFRLGTVPSLLAVWLVWSAFGYATSEYQPQVYQSLVQVLKLLVITVVGVNALRTRGQIRAYSIVVLFAFLIYPGRGALLNYITGAFVVGGSRAVWNGVYSNPNDLAGIALLIVSVALSVVVSDRSSRVRIAAAATAVFVIFIIFLTQSRGALIALGVFIFVAVRRIPKRQRLRAILGVAAASAVVAVFAPASVWERLAGLKNATDTENLGQVDSSAEQRYEIWKVARTIIAEHPLVGVGLGAYSQEHGVVAPRSQFRFTARGNRDTHSTYLNVMAETGFPGFVLFALIVVGTVRYAERVRRQFAAGLPDLAQRLVYLELGLLAFFVAGIWGSYAKLNMLYLHLVLIWATARLMQTEATAGRSLAAPGR